MEGKITEKDRKTKKPHLRDAKRNKKTNNTYLIHKKKD